MDASEQIQVINKVEKVRASSGPDPRSSILDSLSSIFDPRSSILHLRSSVILRALPTYRVL
jgi:hypothetical protein